MLRGQSKTAEGKAGALGRLAVIADGRLDFVTLSMTDVGLGQFEDDASSQFCSSKLKAVKKALKKVVSGAFVATVERGKVAEKLHVHVVCVAGSCSVGRKSKVDAKTLPKLAAYIVKKPLYTRQNAVAYVEVVRAQRNPGRRLIRFGLGQKVSVRQVEKLLGYGILKPQKGSVQNVPAVLVFDANRQERVFPLQPDLRLFHPIVRRAGLSPPAAATLTR